MPSCAGLELKLRALYIVQKPCQKLPKTRNCLQESVFLENAEKWTGRQLFQMKQQVFQMKQQVFQMEQLGL